MDSSPRTHGANRRHASTHTTRNAGGHGSDRWHNIQRWTCTSGRIRLQWGSEIAFTIPWFGVCVHSQSMRTDTPQSNLSRVYTHNELAIIVKDVHTHTHQRLLCGLSVIRDCERIVAYSVHTLIFLKQNDRVLLYSASQLKMISRLLNRRLIHWYTQHG